MDEKRDGPSGRRWSGEESNNNNEYREMIDIEWRPYQVECKKAIKENYDNGITKQLIVTVPLTFGGEW